MRLFALIGLAALALGLALYHLGARDGAQSHKYEGAMNTIKTLRDRGEINAQISHSVADDLCRDYGLPDHEQAECVRRVREASAKP